MNPRVTAIIPAHGGSKGIRGKNLPRVGGRSLVERAVDACLAARFVEEVCVNTAMSRSPEELKPRASLRRWPWPRLRDDADAPPSSLTPHMAGASARKVGPGPIEATVKQSLSSCLSFGAPMAGTDDS